VGAKRDQNPATSVLIFNYTVALGHNSADLDAVSSAALALNGGTIRDAALNNATLTLPTSGTAGSLGANKAIAVDTTAPSAPTGVAYTPNPNNTGAHSIFWAGAADNAGGSGIASYNVRRSADGGATWTTVATGVTGTSWTQSPAVVAGGYLYQIQIVDVVGHTSAFSDNTNTVLVDTTPPSPPGAPVSSPNPSRGSATVSWVGSVDSGGVASYQLDRSADGMTFASLASPTGESYAEVDLAQGEYYYRVRAVDAAGNVSANSMSSALLVVDTTPPDAARNRERHAQPDFRCGEHLLGHLDRRRWLGVRWVQHLRFE